MADLSDPQVRALLKGANPAVVSTHSPDGSILSVVVWKSLEGDELAINSALGRSWPSNLERDARITLLVYADGNPYDYVEVQGTARPTREDADDHIDRLAKLYTGQDRFPRRPGMERVKFVITPERVRHRREG